MISAFTFLQLTIITSIRLKYSLEKLAEERLYKALNWLIAQRSFGCANDTCVFWWRLRMSELKFARERERNPNN